MPVDPVTAVDPSSYAMTSYTYLYRSAYGSDEILNQALPIAAAEVASDGMGVRLRIDGLRPLFVHELSADKLRSADGKPLLHPQAYYTLNRLPQ